MKKIYSIILIATVFHATAQDEMFIDEFTNTGLPLGDTKSYIGEIIDFNNDNFEDIIYRSDSSGILQTQLYINNGDGTFSNVSQFNIGDKLEFYSSPNSPGWSKTFDFNSDGFIDIVCQQADTLRFFKNSEGSGVFSDVTSCLGFEGDFVPKADYSKPQRRLEPIYLSDIDNDNDIDILFGRLNENGALSIWMYENKLTLDGSFNTLVEVISEISSNGSISMIIYDFDNDSNEDIFFNLRNGSVYAPHPVILFKNNGNLNFTDITTIADLGSTNSWGFANVNDLNNDGNFDLIIGSTDAGQHNSLLINNGDGTFTNNSTVMQNGLGNYYYARSSAIDYDNDMDLDVNWEGSGFGFPGAPMLTNSGDLSFIENANTLNLKFNQSISSQNNSGQIDWMDVNNDGRLDHFRSRGTAQAPRLMVNNINNENNYLRVKLKECSQNTNAIGSVVRVFCQGHRFDQSNFGGVIQTQGGSSSDLLHFGIGNNTIIDSIIVNWANGENTTLYNITPNQTMNIEEDINCQNQFNINSVDNITSCGPYTWIDGIEYTESNDNATFTLQNTEGCDSIISLNLTILNSSTAVDEQIACGSFTWIDGITYDEDNDEATFVLQNSAGCDSLVTLDLEITEIDVDVELEENTLQAEEDDDATYQWLDCNDNFSAIAGETDAEFTPEASGDYAVVVTIDGCTDTSDCYTVTSTSGIDDLDAQYDIQLFPNPTKNNLRLSLEGIDVVDIMLFDIQGKVLMQKSGLLNQDMIHLSNYVAGTYFVRIITPLGSKEIRITKQ